MFNTEILKIGPVSSIWLISNGPCLLHNSCLSGHTETPLNVQNVSEMGNSQSGYWCLLMFLIKYRSEIQFLSCFICHFVNRHFVNKTETGPEPEPGTDVYVVVLC